MDTITPTQSEISAIPSDSLPKKERTPQEEAKRIIRTWHIPVPHERAEHLAAELLHGWTISEVTVDGKKVPFLSYCDSCHDGHYYDGLTINNHPVSIGGCACNPKSELTCYPCGVICAFCCLYEHDKKYIGTLNRQNADYCRTLMRYTEKELGKKRKAMSEKTSTKFKKICSMNYRLGWTDPERIEEVYSKAEDGCNE